MTVIQQPVKQLKKKSASMDIRAAFRHQRDGTSGTASRLFELEIRRTWCSEGACAPCPAKTNPGARRRCAPGRSSAGKPWNGIDPNGPIAIAVTPSGCEISGNPIWGLARSTRN